MSRFPFKPFKKRHVRKGVPELRGECRRAYCDLPADHKGLHWSLRKQKRFA